MMTDAKMYDLNQEIAARKRIASVLGHGGPLKCAMSLGGLIARIEAAEDFGATVLIDIK
jgi:hypothetical protein